MHFCERHDHGRPYFPIPHAISLVIINIKELDRANLSNFEKRLHESMSAFDAIRSFNENNFLSSNHLQSLNRIQKIR